MTHSIKPLLSVLLLGIAFVSCKKDLLNENSVLQNAAGNKVADHPNKLNSYYPFRDKSITNYLDSTIDGKLATSKSTLLILGDTTMDGNVYSKVSTDGSGSVTYINDNNGVTTLISFKGDDKITATFLKENEPVGAVWKDEFLNAGVPSTYEWKMMAKGINRTVQGVLYKDVIQVHLLGYATLPVQGKVIFANSEYYYAPDIGLIENIAVNPKTGKTELHRVLKG